MKPKAAQAVFGTWILAFTFLGPHLLHAQTTSVTSGANQNQLPSAPQPALQQGDQNAPSLSGLGFSQSQMQGNPQEQARLNKRTHMLKVHQTLGLLTLIPMTATVFSGGAIKTNHGPNGPSGGPSSGTLDLHLALGSTTGAMYAATAYYAIFAPKIPGVKPTGAIRLHRDLVWIHAPGMLLTGIMGIDAYKQEVAGERIHGFASAHGAVAGITLGAYAASIVAVSWPIHLKFWER